MKRRIPCRFSVKWFPQIIFCVSSVIVSANNSTQNDQVKTNSYTATLVSTTTVPTSLLESTTLGQAGSVYDERTLQSMMMAMVDGKEKLWSYKKKGMMGTHNLDVKLPAQESFFCKLIKRQSVVMFNFCMDGQGWGWPSDDKKGKKKKGKKKKKKKGGGNKKKKGGGKKKKKKKGGGKKGGGKKKKGKGKKKGGQQSGGWGQKKEPKKKKPKGWKAPEKKPKGWKKPQEKGWKPPEKKGWKQSDEPKGLWTQDQPPTEPKGWGEEKEGTQGWGQEEEEEDWQVDTKKGESDNDYETTSQDADYKPKKNYKPKSKVTAKPGKIKSAATVSSYLTEFDLNKWENSDAVKNNPEDINHHFYRATRQV